MIWHYENLSNVGNAVQQSRIAALQMLIFGCAGLQILHNGAMLLPFQGER